MAIPQTPSPLAAVISAKTYNAQWFAGATHEAQIQAAITAAVADGAQYVFIPANMLPYNASLVTFNPSIQMLREGGDSAVWDVQAYGATGDGTTDDTIALQAAITGASTAFGTVFLPAGTYAISTTLVESTSSVCIRGEGTFYNADIGTTFTGAVLKWIGVAGGTMVQATAIAGASNQALKGLKLLQLSLDGQAVAGIGLQLLSVQGSHFADLFIKNTTIAGIDCNVVATLGENRGVTRCLFERVNIRQVNSSGVGFRGNGDATANLSNCTFLELSMLYNNGIGIKLQNADSNRFYGTTLTRVGGGTGIGVELNGNAVSGLHSRSNGFYWLDAGAGGLTSRGTGLAFPAVNNFVQGYSLENGAPLPTVEPGSTFWQTLSTYPLRELELCYVLSSTFTNLPAGDNEWTSDTSLRLKADVAAYTQFRMVVSVAVQGAAGTNVRVQYSTNGGGAFTNADGGAGPTVLIDTTGIKDTGWVNLDAPARIVNAQFRVVSNGGDGVADPKASIRLYVR